MNLQLLKQAIDTEGLIGTDVDVAVAINTLTKSRNRVVPSTEVLSWSGSGGRAAKVQRAAKNDTLTEINQSLAIVANTLILRDGTSLDRDNQDHVDMITGLVAAGILSTSDQTSLLDLATETVTLKEYYNLSGRVREGEVQQARAI